MKHIFDVEIAREYGVNAAVLLENIGYWIKQNEANEVNFYDGNFWTFNSRCAYRELFPYMSVRQIDTAFQKLINAGLIVTGNYNKLAYDRTLWYALTKKGKCILHFERMDDIKMSNGLNQNVEPIPDINTDINTDINADNAARPRFTPPTLEEVKAYCAARGGKVDAERWYNYYSANGWKVGRNKMKDWKAACRTWERNGYGSGAPKNTAQPGRVQKSDGSWVYIDQSGREYCAAAPEDEKPFPF